MTSEAAPVRSPSQQYRRHRGKIAGSCEKSLMPAVFPEVLFDVLPFALKWKEAAANMDSNREEPMVYSFDTVSPSTATCISETKPHKMVAV
jgi:hypothetical protein